MHILIDATANPKVFGLLDAVARAAGRPIIRLEAFAGGIGGFVARSRPGIDPCPQDMRNAYLQFCNENPHSGATTVSKNYATENADGEVMTASDADIAVIAHHAARFVSDCFNPPERSNFPYSMYLIGLLKEWVFEAPFVTIPISMHSYTAAGWNNNKSEAMEIEDWQFLMRLIQKRDHAANSATGNSNAAS